MEATGKLSTRSRSRSQSPDYKKRLEVQVLYAAESDDVEKLRRLIEYAKSTGEFREHFLRIALTRSSDKGNIATTKYMLSIGAPPNAAAENRMPPLLRAIEQDQSAIVHLLLEHGADPETTDKKSRTALMTAAWKNRWHILNSLLAKGADVNKKDRKGRNVLHNLAADKLIDWGDSIIELLLNQNIHIDGKEGRDEDGRTPLHWACSTGKKRLAEQLLTRPRGPKAYIDAVDGRGKTSLHLAVPRDRDDIVQMLLDYGASLHARSDGGWTPFHNACQIGSEKIVGILIDAGADINAKLLNGMSPLHLAAEGGHLEVVKRLLNCQNIKRAARDSFGSTPFLRAAQNRHKDIVKLLSPVDNFKALSEDALGAVKGFSATIVDFGNFHNGNRVSRKSVFDVLYGEDKDNNLKPAFTIIPNDDATVLRWIHLPSNNMAWVEALLTKLFIEEGASDIDEVEPPSARTEQPLPTIVLNGASTSNENTLPQSLTRTSTSASGDDKSKWMKTSAQHGNKDQGKGLPKDKSKKATIKGNKSPKAESKPSNKNLQRKFSQSRHPRSPAFPIRKDGTHISRGNVYTFMPYLHFETKQRCQEMQLAIKAAESMKNSHSRHPLKARTYDEMLIRAHLASSTVSLHIRRTLDQSFYHNIDTHHRDQDQVVCRYQTRDKNCSEEDIDPKLVMVDQMWMWVLGKNIIVTAFPQRWQQPKNDPLNVLDSIIEDINDKTHEPHRRDPNSLTKPSQYAAHLEKANKDRDDFEDSSRAPIFVDKLLDIGQETDLLAETKDIRDELNMMKKVFEDQQHVLPAVEASICDIYKDEQRSQQEVKKRFADQLKIVGMHIKDIDRMDKQAQRINEGIIDMLDLKQKHANAFEARFARDQATSTARQSQTIMVFTIVTIVFLPMSFIAAFFTINIQEFPNGGNNLPLAYVSKYMFGIGLSISIPMIFIAFYLDDIGGLLKNSRNRLKHWRWKKKTRQEFGDGETDGGDLQTLRLDQVLSGARSARKSVDTDWMRERLSVSARPVTAGSAQREKSTGFRMRMSGDVERGLR
ncbi:Ankyrin [Lachnellula willkommii]|uniref:Ankyrin n=1 Tax=Lachnellula willkommii TaxID=215461 RepID=A0A559M814_9HELO|nr:Ankyrin [Lachnellula willkommii]